MRATVLPVLMLLVGVALIVNTLVAGGGVTAKGIVLGVLFLAAGAGRLWLGRKT
jgi:hypothetical protein